MSTNAPHGGAPDPAGAVRPLPPRPNLEFEHKQAKQLLAKLKKGDPESLARVRAHKRDSSGTFKLADAQFTIAREYGFTSWPRLVEYFSALDRQTRSGARAGHRLDFHNQAAEGLVRQQKSGRPIGRFFATYLPRFYGRDLSLVTGAEVTIDEARFVHARMYRYPSWEALVEAERPENLPPENEWTRAGTPDYRAGRAIRSGDIEQLGRIIDEKPSMLERIPAIGYPAPISILHSAVLNELETRSAESRRVTDFLVSRGANLRETLSPMLLGRGFHTRASDIEYLLDRGADPNWLPPNGIPVIEHAICRYWNGEAVDVLARRVKPRTAFWIAAGLGDVRTVARFFDRDGKLTDAARENRPDFGSTAIAPLPFVAAADDQEVIWEAFWIAATNQRFSVLDALLERGFPIDYSAWGSTVLHLAVGNRWVGLVEYLVSHGANVELRGWQPNANAREAAESNFASHPGDEASRRILELCSGRDPQVVLQEASAERAKMVRPAPKFMEILRHARQDALHQGKATTGLENLFVGLLRGEDRLPVLYLGHGGVDLNRLRTQLGKRLDPSDENVDDMPLDDWATEACMEARAETERRRQTIITSLHLLFVLLKPDDGPIADMIRAAGGDVRKVQSSLEGAI